MNKKPYAWLDGIPDKTSDLYNDAGFLNEAEVDEKVDDGFDLDNATDGQLLSCAVVGNVKSVDWIDPPSGGVNYSTTEQDTGLKWTDGQTVYQKTAIGSFSRTSNWIGIDSSFGGAYTLLSVEGYAPYSGGGTIPIGLFQLKLEYISGTGLAAYPSTAGNYAITYRYIKNNT